MTGEDATLRGPGPAMSVQKIGETFRVYNHGIEAVCELWSGPQGWEVRLHIGGELVQSAGCGSRRDVLRTSEAWSSRLNGDGWE